jgi:hypothetical protein
MMLAEEILDCLKKYGRVTVTSDFYNKELNDRQDYWCVMVTMRGTGQILSSTHATLFYAAENVLIKVESRAK